MKPKIEFPHPSPSGSYMGCPARGRIAPTRDCRTLVAASADAAYLVYASTKYIFITSYDSLVDESGNNVELFNTVEDTGEKENSQKPVSFPCQTMKDRLWE